MVTSLEPTWHAGSIAAGTLQGVVTTVLLVPLVLVLDYSRGSLELAHWPLLLCAVALLTPRAWRRRL